MSIFVALAVGAVAAAGLVILTGVRMLPQAD